METSEVYGILKERADSIKNDSVRTQVLKSLGDFCEKASDQGLFAQGEVTKDWLFNIRTLYVECYASHAGMFGKLLANIAGGLASSAYKSGASPSYSELGMKGNTLIKAQTGLLTRDELFLEQPEVVVAHLAL